MKNLTKAAIGLSAVGAINLLYRKNSNAVPAETTFEIHGFEKEGFIRFNLTRGLGRRRVYSKCYFPLDRHGRNGALDSLSDLGKGSGLGGHLMNSTTKSVTAGDRK